MTVRNAYLEKAIFGTRHRRKQLSPNCNVMPSLRRTSGATRPWQCYVKVSMQLQKRCVCGAPAALAIAMQTRQRQTMSEVTVQHTLAERSSQAHVGGLIARTVKSEHVLEFPCAICCRTVASTVAVCESDVSVQTAGMDGL